MTSRLDYKRIILAILLVVISISLLVGIIWLIFFRPSDIKPNNVIPVEVGSGGVLPGVGGSGNVRVIGDNGRLISENDIVNADDLDKSAQTVNASEIARGSLTKVNRLLPEEVFSADLVNGGLMFLNSDDNKFYRLLDDGTKVAMSTKSFPYVENVIWSDDGTKVILEYPDGSNTVHNFSSNQTTTLPKGAEGLDFSDSSDRIAYKFIGQNEDENWLVVSDIDNTRSQVVEPLGENGDQVQVSWSPTNQVVALYREATGLESEEIFFIGLNDENFRSLKVYGSKFKGIWSPDGRRILYHTISSDNSYNPSLWIADAAVDTIGNNNFSLGLITWVDKCVFSNNGKEVYCAVPTELEEGSGIYPEIAEDKSDVFYKIDLNTGLSKLIALPILSGGSDKFRVKQLFISSDGRKLYFLDGFSNNLYYMKIK